MARKQIWLNEFFGWRKGKKGLDKGQLRAKKETREAIIKEFLLKNYEQPSITGLADKVNLKRVLRPLTDEEIKFRQSEEVRNRDRKRRRVGRQIKELKKLGLVRNQKTILRSKKIEVSTLEFGIKLLDKKGKPQQLETIERLHTDRWFRDKLLGKPNKYLENQYLREERINLLSKSLVEKLSSKEQRRLEWLNKLLGELTAGELIVFLEKNKIPWGK
jgi:hypothetical protein